jgi:chorismate-pyruvate lyase
MNLPSEFSTLLATSHLGAVPLSWIPAKELPQPYHKLLVHDHDMTSELAAFHGDSISLTVLHSQLDDSIYLREVTLHAATSGNNVEYGLIEILLDSFPPDLRSRILAGDTPLGAILTTSGLPFRSEPQGYFTLPAQVLDSIFLHSRSGKILFGRYNHLVGDDSNIFARIIEILPN